MNINLDNFDNFEDCEVEITINKKKYGFSFIEAETLWNNLTDFFLARRDEEIKEQYQWEKEQGIPLVHDILRDTKDVYGEVFFQIKYDEFEYY